MRSAIVRIDESRVEVELIDLVKFRPEDLGWHFRYPHLGRHRQSQYTFLTVHSDAVAEVSFASAQYDFVGQDQINVSHRGALADAGQ